MSFCFLYAARIEGNGIIDALKDKKQICSFPLITQGTLFNKQISAVQTGIGKVNSAHAATKVIEYIKPEVIINIGIGGAYPDSGLNKKDIAICTKEIYGDEGLEEENGRFSSMEKMNFPLLVKGDRCFYNEFALNSTLANHVEEILSNNFVSKKIKTGSFITLSSCTTSIKRASYLETKHKGICENMEGAAIAHVCAMYDVELIEIRSISNIVENRDRAKWDIPGALKTLYETSIILIKNLNEGYYKNVS